MATMSTNGQRRFAGFAMLLLLVTLYCARGAAGQGTPLVVASSAAGLSHPTGWGQIQQSAIDSMGDWFVVDFANGSVYEFPANGGAVVSISGVAGLGGGYENPAIAIDPNNNIYLGANWNNGIVMFPYVAATNSWTGLSTLSPSNPTIDFCTNSGKNNLAQCWAQYGLSAPSSAGFAGYFQPWGLSIGANNTLLVGNQNSGNFIFSLSVSGAWTNPTAGAIASEPINTMAKRPISVAQDPESNIYFVEDTSGFAGLGEIPAGTPELSTDAGLPRVDPNLPAVSGVITDSAGDLYVSDASDGVFYIPNPSGTPQTASAVELSPERAVGEVAIDWTHRILYVPTSQTQTNGQADVTQVRFGYAELGASNIGTAAATPAAVDFAFNGNVTPSRYVVVEDGETSPDFAITPGGSCDFSYTTTYGSDGGCSVQVTMTPHSVGNINAKLLLQTNIPVPGSSAGASASVTAYSASAGTLTLIAANGFLAGQTVGFSGATAGSALAPLNGMSFTVQPAGLSASHFEIQTTAVTTSGNGTINVTGYEYSTVSSLLLHGTGVGSLMQVGPSVQSSIGSKLMTPSQIATDSQGNIFVADPAQGKVLMFPAGSGAGATAASIGSGLTQPTGVAVNGAGDVFIADSSNGTVYEIPAMATGLIGDPSQMTLLSGLGGNLSLAADGLDNLYIADPSNKRVVKLSNVGATGSIGGQSQILLTSGFAAPTTVAADSNGNLYVVDGANLFELAGGLSAPTALLNNLAGVTGLAVDPSGAVYLASAGGTTRIPSIGGILIPADETTVASTVSNTSSVALDHLGNIYLTQASGGGITFVGTNSALVVPTPASLTSSTQATATVTNAGNAPLTVTGYTSTNSVDFTGSDASSGGCVSSSPVAAGGTCMVDVTFNPGAGEQGALSSVIGVSGNANDGPVTISAVSTGLTLAGSSTSGTAGNTSQVVNTPLSIGVGAKGGTGNNPTGTVTVTFPTWTVSVPNPCGQASQPACEPAIFPTTSTMTAQLVNGAASLNLSPVLAGTQTITVAYSGDRTYGRSTGSITTNIAKSAVSGIALPTFPDATDINLPFVLEQDGSTPYDGSQTPWQYQFKMNVNTAAGIPIGTLTLMDNSSACPPGTSAGGIGAATCALTGLSGVACPQSSGDGVLYVVNAGNSPTGAGAQFGAACLPMPQNTTYTPIVSTHYITPVFSGDANFLAMTGASTLFQSVRSPVVQITTSSSSSLSAAPSLSVPAGGTASLNLTLSSILGYGIAGRGGQLNDYNFPVSLACDNLPPHAVCTFNYPNPDPAISTAVDIPCPSGATSPQVAAGTANCTPGQATVTINTNVSVGTTTSQNALVSSVTLASIFGLGMLGLFFRRKAFEKGRYLLIVILTLVGGGFAMSITACNTTNLAPLAKLSTPSGTYAVTITAQQVGSQTISLPTGPVQVSASQNQVSLPFYINVTIQ